MGAVEACKVRGGEGGGGALVPGIGSLLYDLDGIDGVGHEAVAGAAASMADEAGSMAGLR